jgi:serine/threonine-protein kinase HipA
MARQCFVFVYPYGATRGIPAGRLEFPEENAMRFTYGRKYARSKEALPVDPLNLPLSLGNSAMTLREGRCGALRDAAPDYWGQLVIARHLRKDITEINLADMYMYANAARVGNLDFRESPNSPEPEAAYPEYVKMDELVDVANRIEREASLTPSQEKLLPLFVQGTSIGGSRPKCTVESCGELWIAKFPSSRDTWPNAKVEYATMRMARDCGITVPEMRLEKINGQDVLLVRRFDRVPLPNGGFGRLGYLSALSALNLSDGERSLFSYPAIAGIIRRLRPDDGPQLYRRMLFNILCRNLDDHPRNHGFLVSADGVIRLSPAFDVTPTPSTPGLSTMPDQAMSVGEYGREGSTANALSRPEVFGVSRNEAQSMLNGLFVKLPQWRRYFEDAGVGEEDAARFENTFETRWMEHIAQAGI